MRDLFCFSGLLRPSSKRYAPHMIRGVNQHALTKETAQLPPREHLRDSPWQRSKLRSCKVALLISANLRGIFRGALLKSCCSEARSSSLLRRTEIPSVSAGVRRDRHDSWWSVTAPVGCDSHCSHRCNLRKPELPVRLNSA